MKRPVRILVFVAATAAGFAAGWFPGLPDNAPPPDKETAHRGPGAPYESSLTVPASAPVPQLPALESVTDCRLFLTLANREYASSHPFVRRAVRDFALRRWLELDAESALQEAERQPGNEFSTEGFAPDLFRVWLDLNVNSAISAFQQANPILARNIRLSFLTTLAEKDPEWAFKVWQTPRGQGQVQRRQGDDPAGEEIFRRWARRDPRRALEKTAPGSSERSAAVNEWAQHQPREALAFVLTQRDSQQYLCDAAFLPTLLQSDPGRAQAALRAAGPMSWRFIGRDWVERDTDGALRWAQSQQPNAPLVRDVLIAAAGKLAYAEPERALEILQQQARSLPPQRGEPGEETPQQQTLREVFASIAATNPERVRELIASEPGMARNGGMAGYFAYAFASDPALAIAQYKDWSENAALKDAAAAAVLTAFDWNHGGGARDPSQLLAAVPELADKVDGRVLCGWAKANPLTASGFILERINAGKPINGLNDGGVLAELAVSQPQYTSLWLRRLDNPELQMETAGILAANWSSFDPEAAAEWINGLPDGPLREAAIAGYRHNSRNGREQ